MFTEAEIRAGAVHSVQTREGQRAESRDTWTAGRLAGALMQMTTAHPSINQSINHSITACVRSSITKHHIQRVSGYTRGLSISSVIPRRQHPS